MANIINNVYFAYTKLKAPVTAIKKTNTEVSVQVVMSEDDADNLLEVCPSANVSLTRMMLLQKSSSSQRHSQIRRNSL